MKTMYLMFAAAVLLASPAFAQANAQPEAAQADQANQFGSQSILTQSNEYKGDAVIDVSSQEIGEIERAWVDSSQQPQYAIISVGGVAGMGETEYLVPWAQLQSAEEGKFQLNMSREQLEANKPTDM